MYICNCVCIHIHAMLHIHVYVTIIIEEVMSLKGVLDMGGVRRQRGGENDANTYYSCEHCQISKNFNLKTFFPVGLLNFRKSGPVSFRSVHITSIFHLKTVTKIH